MKRKEKALMEQKSSEEETRPGESGKIRLPKPVGHYCFACGTANPIGLHLQFYRHDDAVCSDITLGREYEGWENMAHGGIVSTLLDEVMSWTLIYFKKSFFVTRKMQIKYVRPVPIGEPLTVRGKILDDKATLVRARGDVLDSKDRLLARSEAEFAMVPEDKLSKVPEGIKKDMRALFEKLK